MKVKDLLKNVQDVELTPEQEKQIKDYLGIKESKRWKPSGSEKCWTILGDFTIDTEYFSPAFNPDKRRYEYGNLFKTKEEAEFALEKIKVYLELKNFANENNDLIDWNNHVQSKYQFVYEHGYAGLSIYTNEFLQRPGVIYFSSEKLAQQAIQKVGEDRIKKYLFGVE